MPQRIPATRVVATSKDGEVHMTITLELNINLNAAGLPQVTVQQKEEVKPEENEVLYMVPEFKPAHGFQFGKEVSNEDK